MNRLGIIWLVALREIRERTRTRTFKIGTGVTILIVVLGIVLPTINQSDETPKRSVGIVKPASLEFRQSVEQLSEPLDAQISVVEFNSQTDGEDALRDGRVLVLVVPGKEVVTKVALDPSIRNSTSQLTSAVADLARLYDSFESSGVSSAQTYSSLNSAGIPTRGLEPAEHRDAKNASGAAGAMILLFVFLTLYGAWILNGVVEEKTSRVVEVLLSAVKSSDLLAGKVLGIGIVGSIQGVLLIVATFAARAGVGTEQAPFSAKVVAFALMWFLLGFGIYSWAYACAGALVSRSEDAQNLVFPLQIPLLASYAVGMISSYSGPNTASTVMSMIPFTAPITMLGRMSADQAPGWQIVLSIILCLITAYLMMRLAITIFSGGILRLGQRVKLKDAWQNSN